MRYKKSVIRKYLNTGFPRLDSGFQTRLMSKAYGVKISRGGGLLHFCPKNLERTKQHVEIEKTILLIIYSLSMSRVTRISGANFSCTKIHYIVFDFFSRSHKNIFVAIHHCLKTCLIWPIKLSFPTSGNCSPHLSQPVRP